LRPVIGLQNPASVYCEKQGGKIDIRETPEGEIGYCNLPDGTICDEWALYEGRCGPSPKPTPEPDDNDEHADSKDLTIRGKVTKRHMVGPNSNNNFIIIEVLEVQPPSRTTYEYSPGSTIMVRADEYATLYDCVVGR
jgi:hypothetical protein